MSYYEEKVMPYKCERCGTGCEDRFRMMPLCPQHMVEVKAHRRDPAVIAYRLEASRLARSY